MIAAVHLGGVQSIGRYILFSTPLTALFNGALNLVELWFNAVSAIHHKYAGQEVVSQTRRKVVFVIRIFSFVGFSTMFVILPMIFYTNKFTLNWIFSFAQSFNGLMCVFVFTLLTHTTYKLRSACMPLKGIQEATDLQAVIGKVNHKTIKP
jgi:hypothetical protein